jgi:hypothetical protein
MNNITSPKQAFQQSQAYRADCLYRRKRHLVQRRTDSGWETVFAGQQIVPDIRHPVPCVNEAKRYVRRENITCYVED